MAGTAQSEGFPCPGSPPAPLGAGGNHAKASMGRDFVLPVMNFAQKCSVGRKEEKQKGFHALFQDCWP